MSIKTLKSLNLTAEAAEVILNKKPETLERLYWHTEIGLYFIPGRRRNALVHCEDIKSWRTSTRYNEELEGTERFIALDVIQEALNNA